MWTLLIFFLICSVQIFCLTNILRLTKREDQALISILDIHNSEVFSSGGLKVLNFCQLFFFQMLRLLAEQVLLNPTQCGETCVKSKLVFPACQYLSISLATLFPGMFQLRSLIFFLSSGVYILSMNNNPTPPPSYLSYFLMMLGIRNRYFAVV